MADGRPAAWRGQRAFDSGGHRQRHKSSIPARSRRRTSSGRCAAGGGNFGVATVVRVRAASARTQGSQAVSSPTPSRPHATCCAVSDVTRTRQTPLTAVAGWPTRPTAWPSWPRFVACHCGPSPVGEHETQSLKTYGQPSWTLRSHRLRTLNTILDDGHREARSTMEAELPAELTDEAIDTMVDCYARCPSPMSQLLLEHFHGAATRVPCPRRHVRTARRDTTSRLVPVVAAGRHVAVRAMGPRHLSGHAALHGRDCATSTISTTTRTTTRRSRPTAELHSASGDQDEVRSDERGPLEPEHQARVRFRARAESGQTGLGDAAALLCNNTMTDRATPPMRPHSGPATRSRAWCPKSGDAVRPSRIRPADPAALRH
jgi:hypothetical protein